MLPRSNPHVPSCFHSKGKTTMQVFMLLMIFLFPMTANTQNPKGPKRYTDDQILLQGDTAMENLRTGLTYQRMEDPKRVPARTVREEKLTEPGIVVFRNEDGSERLELDWTVGQHARSLMESLRKGIYQYQSAESNIGGAIGVDDGLRIWPELRNIFCREYPAGRYIDLHGEVRFCEARKRP